MRGRTTLVSTLALGLTLGACQTVPAVAPSAAAPPPAPARNRVGAGKEGLTFDMADD